MASLRRRARERGQGNVVPVLAAPDDPRLPAASVDLLFVCNTYHHLEDRVEYLRRLRRSLRPGGRVAVIELEDLPWYAGHAAHQTDAATIRRDMAAAGYVVHAVYRFLEHQSFQVFAVR